MNVSVQTFFNAAPANPTLNRDILRLVDIICVNETEAELITQSDSLNSLESIKNAAKKLLDFGPNLAIITLGKNGVLIAQKSEGDPIFEKIEASKVKTVDTTVSLLLQCLIVLSLQGAGDCFCGAFAYFLVNHPELSYAESAKKASKIAAISVTRNGCQSSYPSMEEAGIL